MSESLPYVPGSDTSKAAASLAARSSKNLRQEVHEYILSVGGAADFEIENALVGAHQSISARRRELVIAGKVKDSGLRKANPKTGAKAAIWVPVPKEEQAAAAQSQKLVTLQNSIKTRIQKLDTIDLQKVLDFITRLPTPAPTAPAVQEDEEDEEDEEDDNPWADFSL